MRFLIDAQLPPRLCDWLVQRGHEAVHVADLGLLAASDRDISDAAARDDYLLVSKDDDFLILRLPDRFGFVWLRIGNATNRTLTAWLSQRWPTVEAMLASGERLVEVR